MKRMMRGVLLGLLSVAIFAADNIALSAPSAVNEGIQGGDAGTLTASVDGDTSPDFSVSDSQWFVTTNGHLVMKGWVPAYVYATTQQVSVRVYATNSISNVTIFRDFNIAIREVNKAPTGLGVINATVPESPVGNQPAVDLLTLTAADPDLTPPNLNNGFTLDTTQDAGITNIFEVVAGSLLRKANAVIAYATQQSYTVRIKVSDTGNPALSTIVPVTVTVTEVNKAPTGLQTTTATMTESPAGDQPTADILTLTGVDPDLTTPNRNNVFALDSTQDTGVAVRFEVVAGVLRRKENTTVSYAAQQSYVVRILVRDAGNAALSTVVPVTVAVTEINKAPTGLQTTTATVAESPNGNQPTADTLTLAAADPDLTTPNRNNAFELDGTQDAGVLAGFEIVAGVLRRRANATIAYAAQQSYIVRVKVRDSGNSALNIVVPVTVTVTEVNKAPTGLQVTTATVAETPSGGQPAAGILTLTAIDPDLTSPNRNNAFALDATQDAGVATAFEVVAGVLRRKAGATVAYAAQQSYTVKILVRDAGNAALNAVVPVTVSVTEVNKAPRGVTPPAVTFNEDIENEPGTAVLEAPLAADDPDQTAPNRDDVVELPADAGSVILSKFEIVSGKLRRKAGALFDFEAVASYAVPVVARDRVDAVLTTRTQVTVTIADRNDPLWIPDWSAGIVSVGDPDEAVRVGPQLAFSDQDFAMQAANRGANGMKLRFALYKLSSPPGRNGGGDADPDRHALGFTLPSGSGLTATGALSSGLDLHSGSATGTVVARVGFENGNDRRVLQVLVQGDHNGPSPVMSLEQLSAVLRGVTYQFRPSDNAPANTEPDLLVECSTEHPWDGFTREWEGWRVVRPSSANQRPTLSGSALGTITVARDDAFVFDRSKLTINDDYPEWGEDIILAYPPLAGQLLGASGALATGDMVPVEPTTTAPVGGGGFSFTYRPSATSTATNDSFIVQVRDHGVDAAGLGQRVSELYAITIVITPGAKPAVSRVVSSGDDPLPVFRELQAPAALVPSTAAVSAGTLTQLTGWSLYAGPKPPADASGILATRALTRFTVAAVDGVTVDGQRVAWTGALPEEHAGARIDSVWNGVGRTLILRLDDGTTLAGAAALAKALRFGLDGHRVQSVADYTDLAVGFVATGDGASFTRTEPSLAVQGVNDQPFFTVDPLRLRVGAGGAVIGVSEIRDADGSAADGWWQVSSPGGRLTILAMQAAAPSEPTDDSPASYRVTWSLLPDAASTSAVLSFSDDRAAIQAGIPGVVVNQSITVERADSTSEQLAFVSNAPFYQRRGDKALLPLVLASGGGIVAESEQVDFAISCPEGSDAAALARIFTPVPSSRQLQVDLTAAGAPAAGSTLRCVLVANRTAAAGLQIAVQPITLRVLGPLPVAPAGVN